MPESRKRFLPGFRGICLGVCVLYTMLTMGLFLQGIRPFMSSFQIPKHVLDSPLYIDAIMWVYMHMLVIGLIIGCLGLYAKDNKLKKNVSRLLFGAHVFYTFFDFRASDSFLGTALYKGPGSITPAIIALTVTLLFFYLGFLYNYDNEPEQTNATSA